MRYAAVRSRFPSYPEEGNMKKKGLRIELHPIGVARKTEKRDLMVISINPEYAEGLDGIERLDYIYVLYWMDRLSEEDRKVLKVHPRGDRSRPLTGVFALRSPMRPNPIGLTRVRLLRREGNKLYVEGLDALDGTPVVDIKSG